MSSTQSIESSLHPPSSSSGSSNNQHSNNYNLVAHIRDLLPLPKHTTFHVKLAIHQLYNVPFVSGDFRIKWKFTHLQAVNSDGRPIGFRRALALKLDTHKKKHSGGNVSRQNTVDSKGKGKERADSSCTTPTKDEGDDSSYNGLTSSPTKETAPFNTPESDRPASYPSQSLQSISTKSDSTRSDSAGIHFHTETRGHTPYYPLKNFKVDFEAEMNAAVQMNVERDTHALLPSELKLTVYQVYFFVQTRFWI
jgi:N-terminal C2 in EEIG1 and EHBP1 proteins